MEMMASTSENSLNAEFEDCWVGLVLVVVAGLLGMVWGKGAGSGYCRPGCCGVCVYQAGRRMHLNRSDSDAPVYEN